MQYLPLKQQQAVVDPGGACSAETGPGEAELGIGEKIAELLGL